MFPSTSMYKYVYVQVSWVFDRRNQLNVIIHPFIIHSFNKYLLCIYSVPGTFLGAREMEGKRKVPACISFNIDTVYQMVVSAMEKNKEKVE